MLFVGSIPTYPTMDYYPNPYIEDEEMYKQYLDSSNAYFDFETVRKPCGEIPLTEPLKGVKFEMNPCAEIPLTGKQKLLMKKEKVCSLKEVHTKQRVTYKRGDIFTDQYGEFFILSQVSPTEWALIGLRDGNRWHTAENVLNETINSGPIAITQEGFDKVAGSGNWERVGSWKELMNQ